MRDWGEIIVSILLKAYLNIRKWKYKNMCTYGQGGMYRLLVSLLFKTLKTIFQCTLKYYSGV